MKETEWIDVHMDAEGCNLMQFTGLLDKNGKEIYEGDVIKYTGDSNTKEEKGEIVWQHERAAFGVHLSKHIEVIFLLERYEIQHSEVIGNIYENPELRSTP